MDRSTGRGRAFLLAKFQLAERVEFVPIRRWGRDSNSRSRCRDTGFQDQLVRPLRHPTALSGFKTTALLSAYGGRPPQTLGVSYFSISICSIVHFNQSYPTQILPIPRVIILTPIQINNLTK